MRVLSLGRLFATCRQVGGVPPRRAAPLHWRPVLAEGRRNLSISCDTSRIHGCARVSAFFLRGLLIASLLCSPLFSFADTDYSASLTAIENLLSNINRALQQNDTDDVLSYLNSLDHYWSSFSSDFQDLMDDVSTIDSNTQDIDNKLWQVSGKLADIYTRLGYVNSTCSSILSNLDLAYAQFEAINGAVTRIARDVGVYGEAILSAFSTLQSTVESIDTSVGSIDDTMQDLLQAVLDLSVVTNKQSGVVYDFSVLTNGFPIPAQDYNYSILRWSSASSISSTRTQSSLFFNRGIVPYYAEFFSLALKDLELVSSVIANQSKSWVITALSSMNISNNVGRLVLQGDTLTNNVGRILLQGDVITNGVLRLASQGDYITNRIETIRECNEWLTNYFANFSFTNNTHLLELIATNTFNTSVSSSNILDLLIAYTNVVLTGYESEKTKLEDEITKSTDDVNDEIKGVKQTNGTFYVSFLDPSAYEQVGMQALENQFPTAPPTVYDFNIQIPSYSYKEVEILRESTLEATPEDIEKIIHFFSIIRQLFTLLAWLFGWYVLHLHFRFFLWVVDKYFESIHKVPKE